MSATFTIYEKSGNTFARIRLSPEGASTFHSDHFTLDKAAAGAETNSIIRDAHMRYLYCLREHTRSAVLLSSPKF